MPTALGSHQPDSNWKGSGIEHLVAAHCVLASKGLLNASRPMFDDSGVDLVFSLRGKPATLAVQVKSRFDTSKRVERGSFRVDIRKATFEPRADLAILAVLYDSVELDFGPIWLVPSLEFATLTAAQSATRRVWVMAMSLAGANNQWAPYRRSRSNLHEGLIAMLKEL